MNKTIQMTNQTYLTHHKGRIQRTWFGVHLHTPHLITAKETEEGSEAMGVVWVIKCARFGSVVCGRCIVQRKIREHSMFIEVGSRKLSQFKLKMNFFKISIKAL